MSLRACWIVTSLLMMAAYDCASAAASDPPATKQFNVVIISIENFDDPHYSNAALEQGIASSTDELIKFFQERFSFAHLTVLRKPDETTSTHLTEFFKGTFPSIIAGNLTLLFVLSHGEAVTFPDKSYGADLRVVTTDTTEATLAAKSLSLSKEVLKSLDGIPPGSFVFGFIDTCHSHAAVNIGLTIEESVRAALGVQTMFLASSLSDQLMYKASFTKALVKLWREPPPSSGRPPCTMPQASRRILRAEIIDILGSSVQLGENEGYPQPILNFNGEFCLETFSADSAIVGLINGSGDSYTAIFKDADGHEYPQPVDRYEQLPVRLSRKPYDLALFRRNQLVAHKHLRLDEDPLDWEPLGTPSVAQIGTGIEATALAAVRVGAPADRVQQLRREAFAAYSAAKDAMSAKRVAMLLGDTWCDATCTAVLLESSKHRDADHWLHKTDSSEALAEKATLVQSFGKFEASAPIFEAAAEKATQEKTSSRKGLASQAYFSYLAVGDYDKAAQVARANNLSVGRICPQCDELRKLAARTSDPTYDAALSNVAAAKTFIYLKEASSPLANDTSSRIDYDYLANAPASALSDPVTCNDGTTAPHGGRGACSGHGGINKSSGAAATSSASPGHDYVAAASGSSSNNLVTCRDGTTALHGGRGACSGHGGISATATSSGPPGHDYVAAASASSAAAAASSEAEPGGGPGQVWVNSSSKVYHCQGDQWYGKTKNGTYISESAAKAQGLRPAYDKACK